MTELGQEYAGENSDGSIELNNELLRNRSFLRATKHGKFLISVKCRECTYTKLVL